MHRALVDGLGRGNASCFWAALTELGRKPGRDGLFPDVLFTRARVLRGSGGRQRASDAACVLFLSRVLKRACGTREYEIRPVLHVRFVRSVYDPGYVTR